MLSVWMMVGKSGKVLQGVAHRMECCARTSMQGQHSLKEHLCPKGMNPGTHPRSPCKGTAGKSCPQIVPRTDFTPGIDRNCLSLAGKGTLQWLIALPQILLSLGISSGIAVLSTGFFLSAHSDCSHGVGAFSPSNRAEKMFEKHFTGYTASDFIFIQPLKSAGAAGISPGRRSKEAGQELGH